MDLDTRKKRTKEFHDVMEKAMARYNDVLMPARCTVHGDDCDPTEFDGCQYEPINGMLRTWALVFGVEELEPVGDIQGVNSVDTFTPEGSMSWEVVGLLAIAKAQITSDMSGGE